MTTEQIVRAYASEQGWAETVIHYTVQYDRRARRVTVVYKTNGTPSDAFLQNFNPSSRKFQRLHGRAEILAALKE